MNRKLLREVADWIEEHPERYNQNVWLLSGPRGRKVIDSFKKILKIREKGFTCGAVGCVAGTAVALSDVDISSAVGSHWGYNPDKVDWKEAGQIALDLTNTQADWLFSAFRYEPAMVRILRRMGRGEGDICVLHEVEQKIRQKDGADYAMDNPLHYR